MASIFGHNTWAAADRAVSSIGKQYTINATGPFTIDNNSVIFVRFDNLWSGYVANIRNITVNFS